MSGDTTVAIVMPLGRKRTQRCYITTVQENDVALILVLGQCIVKMILAFTHTTTLTFVALKQAESRRLITGLVCTLTKPVTGVGC